MSKNILLSFISFLASFLIAELALRYIFEYPLTYSEKNLGEYLSPFATPDDLIHRNDIHTLEFDPFQDRSYSESQDFNYPPEKMNKYGFRGDVPEKNKRIILALGDSFTEGIGASLDSTYPYLLSKLIEIKDKNFSVFNAGTAGNDPFFDFKMLQKLYSKLSINQVIFMLNTSDIDDVNIRGGNERFLENGRLQYKTPPAWEIFYKHSFIFRIVMHNLFKINYNLYTYEQTNKMNYESIKKITRLFEEEVLPWTKDRNIPLKIVLQPIEFELKDTDSDRSVYSILADSLSKIQGLYFYNMLPDIKSKPISGEDIYWPQDKHFNPKGYNLIAHLIFENLFEKKDSCLVN